jgi:hypothetical protein
MKPFIEEILKKDYPDLYEKIFNDSDLLQYLDLKTSAIYGNSKTRKSLANIYAIYSLTHFYINDYYNKLDDYKKFGGYDYTSLLKFCREQYGGEKIQNHALNSRLNLEFDNKAARKENKGNSLIFQNDHKYLLNMCYLYVDDHDISKSVEEIIKEYVNLLEKKDNDLIGKLDALSKGKDLAKIKGEIESLLTEDSEARVFEIISYAILKNYYKNDFVYFGTDPQKLKKEPLTLYKTGRTNANDGGIDFVMRPLGRFFQVTEVGNYDKYFLDINNVLHFPMTFVIKTNKSKEEIKKGLDEYAKEKSGGMIAVEERYKKAIEEIITINELKEWYELLDESSITSILDDIITYYKMEMNLTD